MLISKVVLLAELAAILAGCSGTNKPGSAPGSGGAFAHGGSPGLDGGGNPQGGAGSLGTGGASGSAGGDAEGADASSAVDAPIGGGGATGGSAGARTGSGGGISAGGGAFGTGGSDGGGGMAVGGFATGGLSGGGGGGAAGAGGASASGGRVGTGGASTTGGADGTGGSSGTGGASATGGAGGTGGSSGTGGASATGGASGTGGAAGNGAASASWDFATDSEGWLGGFSDYPPDIGTGYNLQFEWSALPAEVGPGGGLLMSGNNHSDDLFMFIKRQITGLAQSTQYLLDVTVILDSNAPATCGGAGGAPGESVFVKIGAVPFEPLSSVNSAGMLTMNLDKGNQSVGGADMKVVGNISNTLPCPSATYQAKTLSLTGFSVRSASDGTLWLVIGTDSGFEGITTLYYAHISASLTPSP